jgi:hypothetical protein
MGGAATTLFLEHDVFDSTPEQIHKASVQETGTTSGHGSRTAADGLGGLYVRRPTRGIQVTPNTYSTMRVQDGNGNPVNLINSSAPPDKTLKAAMSANYILQSVSESRDEKLQLLETFGQAYGFFFGERPRVVQFSGLLVNTADFNWRSEWWANYEAVFRGTKLVEKNARLYITYDDIVIEGYMLNANTGQQAEANPNLVTLNFSMWVTGYFDGSDIGDAEFPGASRLRANQNRIEESRVATLDADTQALADKINAPYLVNNDGSTGFSPQYRDADGQGWSVDPSTLVVGAKHERRDLETIRSNIFDNVDEYVYSADGFDPEAAGVTQARADQAALHAKYFPENDTEVHNKSFGVLKKNLSGNLDGAMTMSGGQLLAANGEMSAGSVDGADTPAFGALVVRDQMLPTGVSTTRMDIAGGISPAPFTGA